jgi:hypothetical protein
MHASVYYTICEALKEKQDMDSNKKAQIRIQDPSGFAATNLH